MIEIAAAAVGASITIGAMGVGGALSRSRDGRDSVIRLTTAVENVATRLEEIHVDIKEDRKQTYSLINNLDRRITTLEAMK